MKLSIIHIALGAIILAGMSACTQQEHVATEHPVAIVDSLQQIVTEEVLARVNRTEAEWGIGVLMDAHSGTDIGTRTGELSMKQRFNGMLMAIGGETK